MAENLADAQLTEFIREFNERSGPPASELGAAALRSATEQRSSQRPRGPDLHAVTDVGLDGGPTLRVYRPTADETGVLVFFHGGGWVIGDLESHDRACRRLAASSGVVIVAVDYQRAPEHPWPAAIDDALAAVRWVHTGPVELGPVTGRVGVAGDSAGGLIAALTSQRLLDETPDLVPMGLGTSLGYGQIVGSLMGLPVLTDASIPITNGAGTNEDVIVVCRASDLILWEDPLMRFTFEQAPSTAPGQVRLAVGRFCLFHAGRYPLGISIISGTGLVTPSF